MVKQQMETSKVHEAEKVVDVVFPSHDQTAKLVHPGKQPFYFPAPAITAQRATVLGLAPALPIRGNQFNAVLVGKLFVERVRVVRFVADEAGGELVEEASPKNLFHKLALGWRSAVDRYGERKTVTSGDSDDLRTLAAPGGTDRKPPFLALAKVASTNASSRFNCPRSCRYRANRCSAFSSFPPRTHCWNRRWQVWNGGYFSGISRHWAPVPSTHSTPFSTARVSCHGRPRLSARRAGRKIGSISCHCSSVNSQRPCMVGTEHSRAHPECHVSRPAGIYETGSRLVITFYRPAPDTIRRHGGVAGLFKRECTRNS